MNAESQKTIWLAIRPFTDEWAALIEKMQGQPVQDHPERTDFARAVPAHLTLMYSQLREAVLSAAVDYDKTNEVLQKTPRLEITNRMYFAQRDAAELYSNLCELERQTGWAIEIASGRALFSVALNAWDNHHFPISNKPGIGGASRWA